VLVGPPGGSGGGLMARVAQVPPDTAGGVTAVLLLALAMSQIPREKWRQVAWALRDALPFTTPELSLAEVRRRRRRLRLPPVSWRWVTPVVLAALLANEPGMDQLWTAHADYSYPSNISTPTTRYTYFSYDIDGHVTQINAPEGVINYGYDLATGRLIETNTKNSDVQYGYDELGRLKTVTAIKRNGATLTTPEMTTYHYDNVGNRLEVDLPSGVVTKYTYDSLNRMTNLIHQIGTVTVTNLATYSYRLDAAGRRTNAVEVLRQEDGVDQTNTLSWQFDALYRLTNEVDATKSPDGNYSYTNTYQYDLVGNRLQQTRTTTAVTVVTNAYDANDELLQEVTKVNGTLTDTNSYAYDVNGSVMGKTNASGTIMYGYDVANKLTSVSAGGVLQASFLYNEQGIRVSSTTGGSTTHYLIDANNRTGSAQVLEELAALGSTPTMSYVIGDDVLAQCGTTTTAPSYFLIDGHGNNRQLSQINGSVFDHYSFDAYGTVQTSTSSSTAEAAPTTKLYCGEQYDSNLHMYNLRSRYYDSASGRFNQRDIFAGNNDDPVTLHKYLYCGDDAVNNIDPSGQFGALDILIVFAIILVIALAVWAYFTFFRASGAKGVKPTAAQQLAIDSAINEVLIPHVSNYAEGLGALQVLVDPDLTPKNGTVANTPGIQLASNGTILIGTQFLDGNHRDELAAEIYAEFEHASPQLGIFLNEELAEADWQKFLKTMGWQDRAPMKYWHHTKGGM
jgi:RHS repeat-associated protein